MLRALTFGEARTGMGEQNLSQITGDKELRHFMRAILDDVRALERMIESGLIEKGIRRIGAEQEIFLVDRSLRPANLAMQMLEKLNDPQFTTELAQFNLECNLSPRVLAGRGLHELELELNQLLEKARAAARELGAYTVLTGILPTVQQADLGMDAMTPKLRYRQLNDVMRALRGGKFRAEIKGLDELSVTHDNVLFEACNTSFQVHFQCGAEEFARLYNLAQAVTAPVLAAAVNSPIVLGQRLWQETRIALFRSSVDERPEAQQHRGRRARVSFGDAWVKESVLEIFREDIARFRLLLATELPELSTQVLDRGGVPELTALRLHNGTVYRWNRACYGVANGKAHLRIENRALPAGPTALDEVSNGAFFFGLMSALAEEHKDITKVMRFEDAENNFFHAARQGLAATFRWVNGRAIVARDLIVSELLPLAREGLKIQHVFHADITRYLDNIEERVKRNRTGAQWMLDSFAAMAENQPSTTRDERCRSLLKSTIDQQWSGRPVHEWDLALVATGADWRSSYRRVAQVMTRDVFTVHPEDLVDLAASLMSWKHVRHVPVEDNEGRLVGLVSHRTLLRLVADGLLDPKSGHEPVAVRQIMKPDPIATRPDSSVLDAISQMRRHRVSCLPVVDDDQKLVGIVTERDFLDVAARLFEAQLREVVTED
jgi:CBS domain-containing protein/gamma-glutamyl:cysteine ligase YbdK (ATP-grasp superfamily)